MIGMESVSVGGKVWAKRHRNMFGKIVGGPDDFRTLGCCLMEVDDTPLLNRVNTVFGFTYSDWSEGQPCYMRHKGQIIFIGNVVKPPTGMYVGETLIDFSETFRHIIGTQMCVDGVNKTVSEIDEEVMLRYIVCEKVDIITCTGVTHGRITGYMLECEPPAIFTKHDLGGIVRNKDVFLGNIYHVTGNTANVELQLGSRSFYDRRLILVTAETYPAIAKFIREKWFSRACAVGKRKVHQIRLMTVGTFGVGKTCLCRRLLGLPYDSKRDKTTNGVQVSLGECAISRDVAINWKKLSEHEQEKRRVKLFAEQMLDSIEMSVKDANKVSILHKEGQGLQVNAMNFLSRKRHKSNGGISTDDDDDDDDDDYDDGVIDRKDEDDDEGYAGTISPEAMISRVSFLNKKEQGLEVNVTNSLPRKRHKSNGGISTDHDDIDEDNNDDDDDGRDRKDVDDDEAYASTISPEAIISRGQLFHAVNEHLDQREEEPSLTFAFKSFIKKLFGDKETQITEQGKEVELSMWDFGGQHVFYSTHQTFLTWRAIYLLVVDLTKDLNQEIQLDRNSLYTQKREVQGMPKTLGEFVEFWLKTIHTHSICRWQPPEGTDKLCPPIFIVGTHKDKLGSTEKIRQERAEKRFEEIRTFLMSRKPHCDHVYNVFFAVDNTKKNDPSLQDLKNAILEVSQKQGHWGEERPLRWLQIEGKLSEIATDHRCINFASAEKYARDYNIGAEELSACLSFYHEIGTFVYFDEAELRDIVVLDPQWLIDAFKAVITLPQYQHVEQPWHRRFWELLEEKGILREQLVDLAWKSDKTLIENKAKLLNIMQRYDMAHPYPSIAMQTDPPLDLHEKLFVIPSLLPDVNPDEVILRDRITQNGIYLQFQYDFIPHGLFHRLLVRMLRELTLHSRVLFSNYACFRLPRVNVSRDDQTEDARVFEIHCDGFRIKLNVGSLDREDHIPTPCKQVLLIMDLVSRNTHRLKQDYYPNLKQNFAIAVEPNDEKEMGTVGKLSYVPIEKADVQRGFAVYQGYSEIIDTKPYRIWFLDEADFRATVVQQVPESQITNVVQQLVPGPQAMPIQQPATSQQSLPGQQAATTPHNVSAHQSTATQQVVSSQQSLSAQQQVAGQQSPSLPLNIANQPSASLRQDMQRFARLGYLVIHYGAQVLHLFLLREVVEPGLKQGGAYSAGDSLVQMITNFLALPSTKSVLQKLRPRVIFGSQWDLLYPGQGQPDIEKWDVTLLFLLIRNLHPNKANITWSLNQAQASQGKVDLVIKIKECRNTISHGQFQLQTAEYENMWQEMSTAIVQLGGSQKEIDALKVDNFNEEQFRHITQQVVQNELQEINTKMDEVLTLLKRN